MFGWILKRIHKKVRGNHYIMTTHADEEMTADGLSIYDVECGILTGKILERQKDSATAEWKYCIRGETLRGEEVEVVVRISPTGKVVIITLYLI